MFTTPATSLATMQSDNLLLFTAAESIDQASTPVVETAAAAALRNHKEAEKRRRERINLHLDRLRAILPFSSKIDKATLLTKVVQRVRELKQETSEITELEYIPRETDDYDITAASNESSHSGKLILKASLSCEDRADLLPELITVLHSLRLKALKAELCMVGGRVCSVLVMAVDTGASDIDQCVMQLRNALRGIMERSRTNEESVKRRRRLHSIPLHLPP